MPKAAPIDPIPELPLPSPGMNWRSLHRFRDEPRGEDFYFACLQYSQQLWLNRLPARAILCLDRAWAADLDGHEEVLKAWPLPYRPLTYLLQNAPAGAFLGNPRVHFQHYADRLGEPRKLQRTWRSWAGWALVRAVLPELPGDPRHLVEEPRLEKIEAMLERHGHPQEVQVWKAAFPHPASLND